MIWDLPEVSKDELDFFVGRYSCDPLAGAILLRRGLSQPEALRFFFDEDLKSLHNPFLFTDMVDTVDRILLAKEEGERVLVFGDRDVDGITATTLMVSRLEEMGIEVYWQIPLGDEHYGLTEDAVRQFAEKDGTLIITVDCGITSVKEVDTARALGIDTIIIDHHEPQDILPEAVAIIDPKLEDSGYPFAGLCGASLVGKVLWALRFGQTELYRQRFTLLNVRPGNESIIFEALKVENLVEVDRLVETLVPGIVRPEDTRLVSFLKEEVIFLYDEKPQIRLLRQVFGNDAQIGVTDMAPEITKVYPSLSGMSLLRMLQGSKLAKFAQRPPLEIEAFHQLITTFILSKYPQLLKQTLEDLDLMSLGIVSDMMPMVDENRILVKHGLQVLESTPRPGLRELLSANKLLGKPISAMDVGWKIGPIINSTGRMGQPDLAVKLLLAKDAQGSEIGPLLKEVLSLNETRKGLGAQAWDRVYPKAQESRKAYQGRFLLVRDDSVHRGITGILAGRLSREFNAPAAVVAFLGDRAVGSIRSARGFSATGFLSHFEDLFENWGGHKAAGGFSLPSQRYDEFSSRISRALDLVPLDADEDEKIVIDLKVPPNRMDPTLEELELSLQPQGQEFGRIVYLVTGALIEDIQFMGKTQEHVKLTLGLGAHKWPAVMWNSADRVKRDIHLKSKIDLVFHLERNFWGTNKTLQLHILDVRDSQGQ